MHDVPSFKIMHSACWHDCCRHVPDLGTVCLSWTQIYDVPHVACGAIPRRDFSGLSRLHLIQPGYDCATPPLTTDGIDPMQLDIKIAAVGSGLAGSNASGRLVIVPLENGLLQMPLLSRYGLHESTMAWSPTGDIWLAVLYQWFDCGEYVLKAVSAVILSDVRMVCVSVYAGRSAWCSGMDCSTAA